MQRVTNADLGHLKGVVSVYEVESFEEYQRRRAELVPVATNNNILTSAFMTQAFNSIYDAITWQAVGTNSTAQTINDTACTKELYRKTISDKAKTARELVFATFFGTAEASCASTTLTTPNANGLSAVVGSTAGFRIGDLIRIETTAGASNPGGYAWRTITNLSGTTGGTITWNTAVASPAPKTSGTLDQALAEAALMIVSAANSSNVASISSARSGTGVAVTVASAAGFAVGDYVRVPMNSTSTPYEYGRISGISTNTITITLDNTGSTNAVTGQNLVGGYAANHVATLQYVKPTNRTVVIETVISLSQV